MDLLHVCMSPLLLHIYLAHESIDFQKSPSSFIPYPLDRGLFLLDCANLSDPKSGHMLQSITDAMNLPWGGHIIFHIL